MTARGQAGGETGSWETGLLITRCPPKGNATWIFVLTTKSRHLLQLYGHLCHSPGGSFLFIGTTQRRDAFGVTRCASLGYYSRALPLHRPPSLLFWECHHQTTDDITRLDLHFNGALVGTLNYTSSTGREPLWGKWPNHSHNESMSPWLRAGARCFVFSDS